MSVSQIFSPSMRFSKPVLTVLGFLVFFNFIKYSITFKHPLLTRVSRICSFPQCFCFSSQPNFRSSGRRSPPRRRVCFQRWPEAWRDRLFVCIRVRASVSKMVCASPSASEVIWAWCMFPWWIRWFGCVRGDVNGDWLSYFLWDMRGV